MNTYINYPFVKRHRDVILKSIDPSEKGIEIGPYDKPWITKPDYNVRYYDRFTKEHLVHHANKNRTAENIVELDYVADSIGQIDGQFDYIFGSHVFEHFPNPLDFLITAYIKLKAGGRLFLVIPDARYTFDLCRPRTCVSDYIDAFLEKRTKPMPRSIFDSVYWGCGPVIHQDLWANPDLRSQIKPSRNFQTAFDKASSSVKSYIDCHVTITTPALFGRNLRELIEFGILRFSKVSVSDTEYNANDFLCVLHK